MIAPSPLDMLDVRDDARAKRSAVAGSPALRLRGPPRRRASASTRSSTTSRASDTERADERVLVVLGDGPERARLERLARAWQLDVRFLGTTPRRETLGWIGAADELVHASRVEGLSTVVREAEHLGVPVTLL